MSAYLTFDIIDLHRSIHVQAVSPKAEGHTVQKLGSAQGSMVK